MRVLINSSAQIMGRIKPMVTSLGADVMNDERELDKADLVLIEINGQTPELLSRCISQSKPVILIVDDFAADWKMIGQMKACGYVNMRMVDRLLSAYLRVVTNRIMTTVIRTIK